MDKTYYTDEVYHHGVKGQRWGVRRFQNKDGSLTNAGKKRRSIGEVISDHKEAKIQKEKAAQRKAALEKARATKEANKKAAEEKERILRKADPKEILKNKEKFTNEELKRALDRLDLEEKIAKVGKDRVSVGKSAVTDVFINSSKNIGQQTLTYAMGVGVNSLAKAAFKDLNGNIVNPKKGQKDK